MILSGFSAKKSKNRPSPQIVKWPKNGWFLDIFDFFVQFGWVNFGDNFRSLPNRSFLTYFGSSRRKVFVAAFSARIQKVDPPPSNHSVIIGGGVAISDADYFGPLTLACNSFCKCCFLWKCVHNRFRSQAFACWGCQGSQRLPLPWSVSVPD